MIPNTEGPPFGTTRGEIMVPVFAPFRFAGGMGPAFLPKPDEPGTDVLVAPPRVNLDASWQSVARCEQEHTHIGMRNVGVFILAAQPGNVEKKVRPKVRRRVRHERTLAA